MPGPVCVGCRRFYRARRNGVRVLEQMPEHARAEPGVGAEASWVPYRVWLADLYRCEGCGHEIIVGFGHAPIGEHYRPDFAAQLAAVSHTVNDC